MLPAWRAFALVLILPLTAVTAAELRNPESHFFHQSLGDFKEELTIARGTGAPVLAVTSAEAALLTGDSGWDPLLAP
jgi:hypothetical protein